MREILVIRFGALGDLCVLTWALAHLKEHAIASPVRLTLVTKAQFAPLMAQVHGVDEVISLRDSRLSSVRQLAIEIKQRPWDLVIDAHNTLRSNLLMMLLGRRADQRLAKDTLARLAFMSWGRADKTLSRSMRERFFDLTSQLTTPPTESAPGPLAHLAQSGASRDIIGLAPGAQWDTKRWPESHFAKLVHELRAQHHNQIKVFLGPREEAWFAQSELARVIAAHENISLVREPNLPDVARQLATCQLVVTNDSGILHLAETVGTPVLAFYGPTVREFGYFPLLESSRVLQHDLQCRPCSRNGKRPCHRGDLACLQNIAPETALQTVKAMLAEGMSS